MIKTEGLTHIHLVVRDIDRSLRFYQDAFSMKERFRVEKIWSFFPPLALVI